MKTQPQILLKWYQKNARSLPWRNSQDPYKIWIAEVMLQQTTVKAVIPYYEKFLKRFKSLQDLASASIEDVYEYWAGLGYYSRARNLHRAAQELAQNGFPHSFKDLEKLPGFGPYTSRAVASFAFSEQVGVLDGNVIRFLSRYHGLHIEWWKPKNRALLQDVADQWVQVKNSSTVNQALIEIGATICTPTSPSCFLCPLQKSCLAYKKNTIQTLPLKQPRPQKTRLLWSVDIFKKSQQVAFVKNNYTPFLKGNLIFPGAIKKVTQPPKVYDYKHTITRYEIYVKLNIRKKLTPDLQGTQLQWHNQEEIKKIHPASLLQKALNLLPQKKS